MDAKVIDFHTHIGKVKSWSSNLLGSVDANVDDLVEYMSTFEVERAVVLPVAAHYVDIGEEVASTRQVLEAVRGHEDALVPFCAVDPAETDALEKIRSFAERGCRGFGEHKVELPVDHPLSQRVYALCGRLGIPVLVHLDERFNPNVKRYEEMIRSYSDVQFIAHGPAWWASVSADVKPGETYPTGKVEEPGDAPRILSDYSNAFADISATSGLNALSRDREFALEFLSNCHDKIVYGTDFPCIHPSGTQFGPNSLHLDLLRSLKLPEEALSAITRDNARRLLGFR
jgi:hypothetical protein